MDDDGDMAEMYLTQNQRLLEASFYSEQSLNSLDSSRESRNRNVDELEMLLEAYFVVVDCTLNKLTSVSDDSSSFFIRGNV